MLKQIKNGLIHGISFVLIVGIAGISYSAWQTNVERAVSNTPLTAVKYNQLVDRLEEIDSKQLATAWVNFDGTSCSGGAGDECIIRDSFNISKVIKYIDGGFYVYFTEDMQNTGYSVVASFDATIDSPYSSQVDNYNIKYFRVAFKEKTSINVNPPIVSVQVFGGK